MNQTTFLYVLTSIIPQFHRSQRVRQSPLYSTTGKSLPAQLGPALAEPTTAAQKWRPRDRYQKRELHKVVVVCCSETVADLWLLGKCKCWADDHDLGEASVGL